MFLLFLRLMQMLPIFFVLFPLCSQNIIYGRCLKTLKSYSFSQPYPVVLANTHCLSYLFFCSHCQIGIASSHLCFICLWIFFPEKKKNPHSPTLSHPLILTYLIVCAVQSLIPFCPTGYSLLPSVFINA